MCKQGTITCTLLFKWEMYIVTFLLLRRDMYHIINDESALRLRNRLCIRAIQKCDDDSDDKRIMMLRRSGPPHPRVGARCWLRNVEQRTSCTRISAIAMETWTWTMLHRDLWNEIREISKVSVRLAVSFRRLVACFLCFPTYSRGLGIGRMRGLNRAVQRWGKGSTVPHEPNILIQNVILSNIIASVQAVISSFC